MNIYESLASVMAECNSISKGKKSQQGYMYRGIDDVMNALQPLFVANKIFIVPEVLEHTREDRTTKNGGNLIYSILKIRYIFYAEDGTNVSAIVIGEGMDSSDKSSNKAMSIAFKYACFQVLCIPTEEMKDPDADSHPDSTPKEYRCKKCGVEIKSSKSKDGKTATPQEVATATGGLCLKCVREQNSGA